MPPGATFSNPLLANGADPWLQFYKGNYYLAATTWSSQVTMRKSPTLAGLTSAEEVTVWSDTTPSRCCNIWAPEFRRLPGPNGTRWYMMYTAGQQANFDNQHLVVLEGSVDDPMGPYTFKGEPLGGTGWGIDGAYLQVNGNLYLLWSAWVGSDQSLFISAMTDPWTATGPRITISKPTYAWETTGLRVNEGPAALYHGGKTFVAYSASHCATADYQLGLLTLTGSDPMDPASWTKSETAVFTRADSNSAFGPGHNGFFQSPDGTEDWIVYHANPLATDGCGTTRSTRAQKLGWNADGTPNFGTPVATSVPLPVPSGEQGPSTTVVNGAGYMLVNQATSQCLGPSVGAMTDGSAVTQGDCATGTPWVLDPTADGYYRLINNASGKALDVTSCDTADGTSLQQWAWMENSHCEAWQIKPTLDGWFQVVDRHSSKVLDGTTVGTAMLSTWASTTGQQWRLQPVGALGIISASSGKSLDVANCVTTAGANVQIWDWLNTPCQRWSFAHTDNGYYQLRPTSSPASCLGVAAASTMPGGNVEQNACAGDATQWRFEPLADGSVRLLNRNSSQVLDIENCGLAAGTNVRQWDWLDNACQRYHLAP